MVQQLIEFSTPTATPAEIRYITELLERGAVHTPGHHYRQCVSQIREASGAAAVFLTASGSQALEFAALVSGVGPGDEVIMSSYTYYSSANAFLLRGAKIVCIDIDPTDMTMDADLLVSAITPRTRAVVAVHYGGVSSDLDTLQQICSDHHLLLIEDAAQSMYARYDGRALGSIGAMGCFSFHATKNITSGGEGGALLINDPLLIPRAREIAQHGTDRDAFLEGKLPSYTWRRPGSSYMMSELNAACLQAQLESIESIQQRRRTFWNHYRTALQPLVDRGDIGWQRIPAANDHNSHLFYITCGDASERAGLISRCDERGIQTATHYVPLHTTPYGRTAISFRGEDRYTTMMSQKLLRLPLHDRLTEGQLAHTIGVIFDFYGGVHV
jgi:dTDP-4-amino-4,6-dideoxygalactose transaminase